MRKHNAWSEITGKCQKKSPRKSCDVGLRCEKSGCFLRSSDAKCLRFGLPLRFGLRCEHPRCQIASDSGRAMRATKDRKLTWSQSDLSPRALSLILMKVWLKIIMTFCVLMSMSGAWTLGLLFKILVHQASNETLSNLKQTCSKRDQCDQWDLQNSCATNPDQN